MSEAENLFGAEHVRRYRETGGEVGHIWKRGSKILLLTTKGRRTGEPTTTPLIYEDADGAYVIVASRGAPWTGPAAASSSLTSRTREATRAARSAHSGSSASSWPYSFIIAPHPAAFDTM